MRNRFCLSCFTFLLLIGFTSAAQDIVSRFTTLGVNEGLSQNSVNNIYQDSRGYMWFCTGDGLNRYDGNSIKVFRIPYDTLAAANSNAIRDKPWEDKLGNIWFSTEAGLFYFDRTSERIIAEALWDSKKEWKKYKWTGLVYTDEQNNIYLLNHGVGVVQYNTATKALQHFPLEWVKNPDGFTSFSVADREGNIWFRRKPKDGVHVFHTRTWKYSQQLQNRNIIDLCFGKHKRYLLAPGILYITDSAFHPLDSIPVSKGKEQLLARAVFEDAYERALVLTYGQGIFRYDAVQKRMLSFSGNDATALDYPIALYNDRNNNLWIGTEGNGVCRIDSKPKKFHLFPVSKNDYPQLTRCFIKSICEDRAGKIWFSTHGSGVFVFDKEAHTLHGHKNAGDVTGAIFRDKDGNMWVGSSKGIFLFKGGHSSKISVTGLILPKTEEGFVSRFLQLPDGGIIAATSNGLVMLREQKGIFAGTLMAGSIGGKITDIVTTATGDIWVSIRYAGICRISIDNNVATIKETYLAGSYAGDLHADEANKDVLWVSADKGLISFSLSSKKMTVYNEKNGMANSLVYGVLEDSLHNLWMSTNGGISRFERKTQTFKNYTVKDGLQSNEFNSGAFYKNDQGIMYFGGINGFNWFDPLMPQADTVPPLLDVTAVSIDDSLISKKDWVKETGIAMQYQKKSISFSFAVLDYTRPDANMIAYRLNGNGKWYTTNNKTIVYSSLAPGAYSLQVKAINSSGIEGKVQSILFSVLPPFWRTYWFVCLLGLAVMVIIILITRNIAQQKLKKQLAASEQEREIEKERQRISREMHDDIGAGLTQITLMSEMAKNKAVSRDQKELQDIASTSRKLVNSMSEIIWSLNPEGRTLERLFAYLRETLNQLLEYSNIAYLIDFPDDTANIALNDEQRRNILLIVKEAVNNAVKYSMAEHILIKATIQDTELRFEITDDGIGFDPQNRIRGNGMSNMDKRVLDLDGTIHVQSAPGDGTSVHVSIPLKSHSAAGK